MDLKELEIKNQTLKEVGKLLKNDFVGLDIEIDKIMETIKIWYLMPNLIKRPVIVNLWGMTGTGKTDLVRKLVKYLKFSENFVEMQMGSETVIGWSSPKTLKELFLIAELEEGKPNILLLDEFQRFRTKDNHGEDIRDTKFSDLWMMLSDGNFSKDMGGKLSKLVEGEIFEIEWEIKALEDTQREIDENSGKKRKRKSRRPIGNSALADLMRKEDEKSEKSKKKKKKTCKVTEFLEKRVPSYKTKMWEEHLRMPKNSLRGITNGGWFEVLKNVDPDSEVMISTSCDYSKTLIFVCGNIDSAYQMSTDVANADTDADILHKHSLNIDIVTIKSALKNMFKPEQISRLGSNHIIYPCLSKSDYKVIISNTVVSFLDDIKTEFGFTIDYTPNLIDSMYRNYVFPSQGVRPVFSGVGTYLSALVPAILFQALNNGDEGKFTIDIDKNELARVSHNGSVYLHFPYNFDIRNIKDNIHEDQLAMYATHEAGHAVAYALLFGVAPKLVNIELTSFDGAYVMPHLMMENKSTLKHDVMVLWAGRVAEEIVFGDSMVSAGASSDIATLTKKMAKYVRCHSMDESIGFLVNEDQDQGSDYIPTTKQDSFLIEKLVNNLKIDCNELLNKNSELIKVVVRELLVKKKLNSEEFYNLTKEYIPNLTFTDSSDFTSNELITPNYQERLDAYLKEDMG